jgi:hypothetical protein
MIRNILHHNSYKSQEIKTFLLGPFLHISTGTFSMDSSASAISIPEFGVFTGSLVGILCVYLRYVNQQRYKYFKSLDALIPLNQDVQQQRPNALTLERAYEIFYQFGTIEFPFLNTKALEFALFKTYSIPSISAILVRTEEMETNMPKRYDDTDLLIREFTENPPNSLRSNLALQRLNFLHSQYPISNNDYLYTLSVFIVEPIQWIQRYGYRSPHSLEKESLYLVWCDIGKKMGIRNIPNSWEAIEKWMTNYEQTRMKFHPSNQIIANSTIKLFLSVLPSFLHPLGSNLIAAFCSPALRRAMGFHDPPSGISLLIDIVMLLHANFIRFFCLPRSKPLIRTPLHLQPSDTPGDNRTGVGCPLFHPYAPTYKDGYRIDELGPARYKENRELCPLKILQE